MRGRHPTAKSLLRVALVSLLLPVRVWAFDPFATPAEDVGEPAIEADVSGLAVGRYNVDLARDRGGERIQEGLGKLLLSAELQQPGRWRLQMSGYGDYLIADDPEGVDAEFSPELWDAYAVLQRPSWELSVGQQVRRWGRGVPSIWDVVNPANISEFLFVEDEFTKLPVPMLRWTRFADDYELELVYLPFYRGARQAANDSDWSVIAVRETDADETTPLIEQAIEENVQPGLVLDPADNFLHPDFGMRLTPYVAGWDIDLFLWFANEDLPPPEFSEDFLTFLQAEQDRGVSPVQTLRTLTVQELATFQPDAIYETKPQRQWWLGGAIAHPLASLSWRAEVATISRYRVYRADLEQLRVPSLQVATGLDALSDERLLWSITAIGTAFFTRADLFLLDPINITLVGWMRAKPAPIDLWIELRGLWNLNLGDAYIGPSLGYDILSGLTMQVGVNIVGGPVGSPLNEYDTNDFAYLRMRYAF